MIKSVRLEPADRKFVVAAITLGFNDEAPFPRSAKREVKITLPQPEDAEKPFDLEVDVDRGVATFPFPLPEKPANEFLADDFKGWGEAQNEKSARRMSRSRPSPRPPSRLNLRARKSVG